MGHRTRSSLVSREEVQVDVVAYLRAAEDGAQLVGGNVPTASPPTVHLSPENTRRCTSSPSRSQRTSPEPKSRSELRNDVLPSRPVLETQAISLLLPSGSLSCRHYPWHSRHSCDSDANAYPGQTTPYSTADKCSNFDYNCDGHDTPVPIGPIEGSCTPNCYFAGVGDCEDWNSGCVYYEVTTGGLVVTEHQLQCHYLDTGTPECWVGDVTIRLPGGGQPCD
jgi:hypothetical protein